MHRVAETSKRVRHNTGGESRCSSYPTFFRLPLCVDPPCACTSHLDPSHLIAQPEGGTLRSQGGTLRSRTVQADEALLTSETFSTLPQRRRHATIVRIGEKRILHGALETVQAIAEAQKEKKPAGRGSAGGTSGKEPKEGGAGKKRRGQPDAGAMSAKKVRR
jgi:hypothetical protein